MTGSERLDAQDGKTIQPFRDTTNIVGTPDDVYLTEGITPTVISGNNNAGIDLAGDDNLVGSCYVGTDVSGLLTVGNNGDGIDIEGNNDSVGTALVMFTPLPWRIISGNAKDGISEKYATKVSVYHSYIGVDGTGLRAKPNGGSGVKLLGGNTNTVENNVISGNSVERVALTNESGDQVMRNIIGLGSDGTTTLDKTNLNGIVIKGVAGISCANNTIGATGAGNTISGNAFSGIIFFDVTASVVQGNYIGLNAAGTLKRPNGLDGIDLGDQASNNTIGGRDSSGLGNVISGNGGSGIDLFETSAGNNVVEGNYIGTNPDGTVALGNGGDGIAVTSNSNTIGGNEADGEGNVISANAGCGISFSATGSANTVQGNYIGTNAHGSGQVVNGMNVFGNGKDGIYLAGSCNNVGGESSAADGIDEINIISGNQGNGINIDGGGTNVVAGNWIGLDGTGAAPLGNLLDGVALTNSASGNIIGSTSADQRNVISGNGSQPSAAQDDGVYIGNGANNNYLWGNYSVTTNEQTGTGGGA